jgi:hypothetical protein
MGEAPMSKLSDLQLIFILVAITPEGLGYLVHVRKCPPGFGEVQHLPFDLGDLSALALRIGEQLFNDVFLGFAGCRERLHGLS